MKQCILLLFQVKNCHPRLQILPAEGTPHHQKKNKKEKENEKASQTRRKYSQYECLTKTQSQNKKSFKKILKPNVKKENYWPILLVNKDVKVWKYKKILQLNKQTIKKYAKYILADTSNVKKQMKRCSIFFIIMEIENKTMMRQHHTTTRMAKNIA